MGTVVRFPQHHARASTLNPKTAGSASQPIALRASLISRNLSDGISPRVRQFTTAEGPTPAAEAVLVGPPSASITASTEVSIPPFTSRNVKMSSLHTMGIVTDCELIPNIRAMRSLPAISARLVATQQALGISPAKLCKDSGISQTQWSQFTDPDYKRRITLAAAFKLKDTFGITLEWIFDGDRARLPHEIASRVKDAA